MTAKELLTKDTLTSCNDAVTWWLTDIQFIENDIIFIDKLLNSSAFEQHIRNAFEHLEAYKQQIKLETKALKTLKAALNIYQSQLPNTATTGPAVSSQASMEHHELLKTNYVEFSLRFKTLKSKIFNYTGRILKT